MTDLFTESWGGATSMSGGRRILACMMSRLKYRKPPILLLTGARP